MENTLIALAIIVAVVVVAAAILLAINEFLR